MKPASSAFSHPQSSSRRRVSIRSSSAIIGKPSSSGETLQQRGLQAVEEEDYSSLQNALHYSQNIPESERGGSATSSSDVPAASKDSDTSPTDLSVECEIALDDGPQLPLAIAPSLELPSASAQLIELDDRSESGPRSFPSSTATANTTDFRFNTHLVASTATASSNSNTKRNAELAGRSSFDGIVELSPIVALAASAAGGVSGVPIMPSTKAEMVKSSIAQHYSNIHKVAARTRTAQASQGGRSDDLQNAAGDKSGWVDKVKRNIVGFFEGGDSDGSSSDEDVAGGQHAEAHAPPVIELDIDTLQKIIVAVKATLPPIVQNHKKNPLMPFSDVLLLTFKGSALVDWLLDRSKAGTFAVQGRAQAVAVGEAMCSSGLIRNIEKGSLSAIFKDADLLYRRVFPANSPCVVALRFRVCVTVEQVRL
jgi:hypothetical protein